MNTLTILTKARALISDPARWTQEAFARGKSGKAIREDSPHAVCWCAIGAVYKSAGRDVVVAHAVASLSRVAGMSAHDFNDTHTHAEVIALFDKAIEAARATQS